MIYDTAGKVCLATFSTFSLVNDFADGQTVRYMAIKGTSFHLDGFLKHVFFFTVLCAGGLIFFGLMIVSACYFLPSYFSAFLLLCFSASLLFCCSAFLLLCFSAFLLLCFSAPLLSSSYELYTCWVGLSCLRWPFAGPLQAFLMDISLLWG